MLRLQNFLRKPAASQGIVAISFLSEGFSIAICQYAEFQRPRLLHCGFVPISGKQLPEQLGILVRTYQLQKFDCHILLAAHQYRSISLEAPAVPAEEVKPALRWKIADLIDFPVDRAMIDYYALPNSHRPNAPAMMEAITSDSQLLQELVSQCRSAGLNVRVIDIQETALRNLATLLPENQQGVAVLYLQKFSGLIVIQKQGSIYLSRRINIGYQQLDDSNSHGSDGLKQKSDLALDLQRSLDYVESHFGIPPISSLAMILMPTNSLGLLNFLNIDYGITARALDLSAVIDVDIILDDNTQNLCAPVIGACLRNALKAD